MSNIVFPNPDQYPDWKSWAGVLMTKMRGMLLDASDLAGQSITADKIAAHTITGDQIEAGSITTSSLTVGAPGAALNSDPQPSDIAAWADATAFTPSVSHTVVDIGVNGKVGTLTLQSAGGSEEIANFPQIPVDPGKTYRAHLWRGGNGLANGTDYFRVYYYDQLGVFLSVLTIFAGSAATATWTESVTAFGAGTANTIPAGAFYMAPGIALNHGGNAGRSWMQDIRIEEALPNTLIKDGSITTAKIAALAVTAAQIAANTITAGQIAADTITASQIAANAITSSELNAAAVTAGKLDVGAINATNIIADNIIVRGKIISGEITSGGTATDNTGPGSLNNSSGTVDLINTTFTGSGGSVLFATFMTLAITGTNTMTVYAYRDSTLLYTDTISLTGARQYSLTLTLPSTAASHTWHVYVSLSGATGVTPSVIELDVKDWFR